jgi:hypothetical protein
MRLLLIIVVLLQGCAIRSKPFDPMRMYRTPPPISDTNPYKGNVYCNHYIQREVLGDRSLVNKEQKEKWCQKQKAFTATKRWYNPRAYWGYRYR